MLEDVFSLHSRTLFQANGVSLEREDQLDRSTPTICKLRRLFSLHNSTFHCNERFDSTAVTIRIPHQVRFWSFLIVNVISLSCTQFYRFWVFVDYFFYSFQIALFAWATMERHILIFHDQYMSRVKKRFFVHYLPVNRHHYVLPGQLLYCILRHSVRQSIRWIPVRRDLHSVCVRRTDNDNLGTDDSSDGSNIDHHFLFARPDRSRCLSEDSRSSTCSRAKTSQDDHPTVCPFDYLFFRQYSMGSGDSLLWIWITIGIGHWWHHLWKIFYLLYRLLVPVGDISFAIRITRQISREDSLSKT